MNVVKHSLYAMLALGLLVGCQSGDSKTAAVSKPIEEETGNPIVGEDARAVTERNAQEAATSEVDSANPVAAPVTRPSAGQSNGQSTVVGDTVLAYVPPPVGTVVSYKINAKGRGTTINSATLVEHDATFNGVKVMAFKGQSGGKTYRDHTYNRVGRTDADGKVIESFPLKREYFKFPMKPGDARKIKWQRRDHNRGRSHLVNHLVTVGNWETITVPAGTFKVLPVTAKGISGSNGSITFWFSPKLGTIIKGKDKSRNFWANWELTSYKRGTGTLSTAAAN